METFFEKKINETIKDKENKSVINISLHKVYYASKIYCSYIYKFEHKLNMYIL